MAKFQKSIQAADDDAYQLGSTWTTGSSTLTLSGISSATIFLRFPIFVPKGSTITNAELVLTPSTTNSTSVVTRLGLLTFSNCPSLDNDISANSPTQFVNWTAPNTTANTPISSPDIGELVASFISNSDYVPGNYMGIRYARNSGSGTRVFYAFENGGHESLLKIDFIPPKQSVGFSSGKGKNNTKTSIIEIPDTSYFNMTKFVFKDSDGSAFSIKTNSRGVIGKKSPNISDANLGYLEIDLPTKKFSVFIYNENGELIGETFIDQRPKGTYGRKISRQDAGGVNLVDTTESKTNKGSIVSSVQHISEKKTSKGSKIISSESPKKTSRGEKIINDQ